MDEKLLLKTSRFRVVEVERAGEAGHPVRRQVVRHPGAVAVVPLVDEKHVCLIRNYRVAIGDTLIEIPAGTLETGEDPQVCAERELAEETGYRAERIELLHRFFLSPGILDERMHLYVARGLTAGDPARESGEEMENLIVAWDEALEMIHEGTIRDAKTIIGLLYYDRLLRAARRSR